MITQVAWSDAKSIWDTIARAQSPAVPFLSYDWHDVWFKTLGQEEKPVILLTNDRVIAPFLQRGTQLQFSGGEEIADFLDIIGADTEKPAAWENIIQYAKEHGITHIHLRNVPQSSATYAYFLAYPTATVTPEDTTPTITLPPSWEAYLETLSRKHRHELERKIRKFEREHIDAVIEESSDPKKDIEILVTLMTKDPAKQTFLTPGMKTFFTEMTNTFSEHVSLLILSMGDKKAAATFSFVQDDTYYLYNSGFDKTCCANGGFYLKAQSVKRAIERGMKEYNFLQGSERYKYELGAKDAGIYTIDVHIE
jgi:CelD/BcsL family acetyltransferase involved in cellulose biosynthesis